MNSAANAPALLTMPHYGGTLASARYLAARGVEVAIASDRLLAPALWSKHVTHRVRAPSVAKGPAALARWLCDYGRQHPGTVLHATSDDMAWVIARYAAELRQYFHLYVPTEAAVRSLLDKSALHHACVRFGVPTPRTWFPTSEAELAEICDGKRQLLLKPRAQLFFPAGGKGEVIADRAHALKTWWLYRRSAYAPGVIADFPELHLPLLQEYEPTAAQGTYSISGFVTRSGGVLGARASIKVLQTSRVGIGMCFIASEVDQTALGQIARLCQGIGYFGMFEVEFVRRDGTYLMIDFNPRYYGQMGFDIARGAPFPWLVQRAALGDTRLDEVPAAVARDAPESYQDRVAFTWWLGTALVSGAIGPSEAARWHRIASELSKAGVDATWLAADPAPAVIAAASALWSSFRHPKSFVRSTRKLSEPDQLPILNTARVNEYLSKTPSLALDCVANGE
jgi:predicted ATP-grasp superfamily ATP-dependent carboligase